MVSYFYLIDDGLKQQHTKGFKSEQEKQWLFIIDPFCVEYWPAFHCKNMRNEFESTCKLRLGRINREKEMGLASDLHLITLLVQCSSFCKRLSHVFTRFQIHPIVKQSIYGLPYIMSHMAQEVAFHIRSESTLILHYAPTSRLQHVTHFGKISLFLMMFKSAGSTVLVKEIVIICIVIV